MSEPSKDKDQQKGDEVLRRLLKTPPKPKRIADVPHKTDRPATYDEKAAASTSGASRGQGRPN